MDLDEDQYLTLVSEGEGLFRDRGSKFLAYAFPASEPETVLDRVAALRQEHPKARHYCFAYRLGTRGDNYRANDDGEPGGSAGKPILGQIDSFGLTDAGVIVVRYFGGTKLGVSGLIQAYKLSAAAALEAAPKKVCVLEDVFRIEFGYERMGDVMAALERMGIALRESHFGQRAWVAIGIRQKDAPATLEALRARLYDVNIVPLSRLL